MQLSSLSLALTRAGFLAFNPLSLFSAGQPGVWYDPSDMTTLFQDAAGTTPVTAVEQPVGLMLDKSGNNLHATQSTSTSRPVLKQDANGKYYLFFDGVDDWMVTPTSTPGIDKVQVFAGVRKLREDTDQALLESSSSPASFSGSISLRASSNSPAAYATYRYISKGTSGLITALSPTDYTAPITNILTGVSDIGAPSVELRVDGISVASNTTDQGTGNYGNYPLYIGRRGGTTLPFNGHLYSLITRFGPNLSTMTIQQTETYVAQKTGITI